MFWITAWILLSIALLTLSIDQITDARYADYRTAQESIELIQFQRLSPAPYPSVIQALQTWEETGLVGQAISKALPVQLQSAQHPTEWKARFLHAITPSVLTYNDLLLSDRDTLITLIEKKQSGKPFHPIEEKWLQNTKLYYKFEHDNLALLLEQIDIIPPSLTLAQAAIESAWGRSRFAVQGNALFGQWTWGNDGIVPQGRPFGATYRVKSFPSPLHSIAAYARNLNTHPSYKEFRKLRAQQRRNNQHADSLVLADTLINYSTRREAYPLELRQIIRVNDLLKFDAYQLSQTGKRNVRKIK